METLLFWRDTHNNVCSFRGFIFCGAHNFILNMPCINIIQAGCRVRGKIGELVDNPSQALLPNGKKKRRVRREATGTVIDAYGPRRWNVRLDSNNTIVPIYSQALFVIDELVAVPLDEVVSCYE